MTEQWKTIEGFEDSYEISNYGRVKSLERIVYASRHIHKTECILKLHFDGRGLYKLIGLWKNGKLYSKLVHRLVALAFIPIIENKKEVNHIDGNKTNNHVDNLEWCTRSENQKHMASLPGYKSPLGKKGIYNQCGKVVLQYTKDGDFIKEYPSAKQVQRELGFASTNITACCNGSIKTSRGFLWEFKI